MIRQFASKIITVGIIFGLPGISVSAEQSEKEQFQTLTIEKCLELANERNLKLQSERLTREEARGRVIEARSGALPQLDLSAQYVRLDDVPKFEQGPRTVEMGQLDNYEAAAEIRQILYSGGGVSAAIDLAQAYSDSTEARIDRTAELTAYRVHAAFNRVLLARESCNVARKAMEMAERNFQDVRALEREGMAKRFDELRGEAQRSEAESNLIAAQNDLHKAKLSLLKMLELPFDPIPEFEGSLSGDFTSSTSTNLLRGALANRRDYAALMETVEMRRHALEVARSNGRPNLVAFGNAKRSNPNRSFQDEWENSWEVGARASWPLFDGMQTKGKVMQAKSNLEKAKIEECNLKSEIKLEISHARSDLETAEKVVSARKRNVDQAREALRLARQAYKEGLQSQIDVVTAQLALTESRHKYKAALYRRLMAERALELAAGEL